MAPKKSFTGLIGEQDAIVTRFGKNRRERQFHEGDERCSPAPKFGIRSFALR